ncbi:hypothetical protein ACRAWD_25725 [Caulobacter segnis]
MTAGEIRAAFFDRKPQAGGPRGLNIRAGKDGRLTEVWVCMDEQVQEMGRSAEAATASRTWPWCG